MNENIWVSADVLFPERKKIVSDLMREETDDGSIPIYVEPKTTNVERIEIFYERDTKEYNVPRTTGGEGIVQVIYF